jgi:hypothetical protein
MLSPAKRGLSPALALLCTLACGPTVPAGGVRRPDARATPIDVDAVDALPSDLDLVLRVDLTKVNQGLGPDSARDIVDRALEDAGSRGVLRRALAKAEVVWLALRVADLEAGDRVLVVQHTGGTLKPDPNVWHRARGDGWARFDARRMPQRNGFERIYQPSTRELMFVSPVETKAFERVLSAGADAERGQPAARGLLSLDYRASRLSPDLAKRFPSLARLMGGMKRVEATVDMRAGKLELEGRIRCKNAGAAQRVLRFLDTIREVGKRSHAELLKELAVKRDGSTVTVRWPLPPHAVAQWIARDAARPEAPP